MLLATTMVTIYLQRQARQIGQGGPHSVEQCFRGLKRPGGPQDFRGSAQAAGKERAIHQGWEALSTGKLSEIQKDLEYQGN